MIRVYKQEEVPESLQKENCTAYDGQDVQDALYENQYGICYLCDQKVGKNSQIEHLRPKAEGYFPELKYKWTNLFLACPYCNGRKPNALLLLDPTQHQIESIISQRLNSKSKQIEFTSERDDREVNDTIELLNTLHNGKKKMRDRKTQEFYKDIEHAVNEFMSLLLQYKEDATDVNKQYIIDSLANDKEFLGLKYWMIKDYGFAEVFGEQIENRTHK